MATQVESLAPVPLAQRCIYCWRRRNGTQGMCDVHRKRVARGIDPLFDLLGLPPRGEPRKP